MIKFTPHSLAIILFACSSTIHAEDIAQFSINDYAYTAILSENKALTAKLNLQQHATSARHYEGRLRDDPNSWIRVSKINNKWQGIIFAFESLYIINPDSEITGNKIPKAERADSQQIFGDTAHSNHSLAQNRNAASSRINSTAQQYSAVPFPELCSNDINARCLIAKMEFAFDKYFTDKFPNGQYEAEAISLINMTEGFFRSDFKIGFQNISINFIADDETPADNIFSTTTNEESLLTDIEFKKLNNSIKFLKSREALFHFVTGRNFNSTHRGRANSGICAAPTSGLNVGTSQYFENPATTAIIMAHHLGHNFGAVHDGTTEAPTCTASNNIMNAAINSAATSFSACSISDIKDTISAISTPSQCFSFPVDLSIRADINNPTQYPYDTLFTKNYDISTVVAYEKIQGATISGKFTEPGSKIIEATLGGTACGTANENEYTCTMSGNIPDRQVLTIFATSLRGSATLKHSLSVTAPGTIIDVDSTNDTLTEILVIEPTIPPTPSDLFVIAGNNKNQLIWQDNAFNETAYYVERRLLSETTWSNIGTLLADTTTYSDTIIVATESYVYRVLASNEFANSLPSNEASVTATSPSAKIAEKRKGVLQPLVIVLLLTTFLSRRFKHLMIKK